MNNQDNSEARLCWWLLIGAIVGIAFGIFVAHKVQFDWKFFGATFVSMGDILELWSACVIVGGCLGAYVAVCLMPSSKKTGQ